MGDRRSTLRTELDRREPGSTRPAGDGSPQLSVLELQRTAGNRAVGRLLARQVAGTVDPDAQRKATATRVALDGQLRSQFAAIEKLRETRINAWEQNAEIPNRDVGPDVLGILIAIVSEGIGGIVYGVIEDMMAKDAKKWAKEFATLAGLEAGDLAAEAAFRETMTLVRKQMETARVATQTDAEIRQRADAAIVTKKGTFAAYAEAMRLQMQAEEHEQNAELTRTATDKTDADLVRLNASWNLVWEALFHDPTLFMRQLTVGYTRLLDEAWLADKAKTGESKTATRARVDEPRLRPGNLLVLTSDPIGRWENPDLSVRSGIRIRGEHVNEETFANLRGARLQDLPLTMSFAFKAVSPYNYFNWGFDRTTPDIFLAFVRDPDGGIFMTDPRMQDDAKEWLASYYTRKSADHTDVERDLYAPRGAMKLWEAIKSKTVTATETI
jgi:hypothetical protein